MNTLFHNVSKIILEVCYKIFCNSDTIIDTRILKTSHAFLVSK